AARHTPKSSQPTNTARLETIIAILHRTMKPCTNPGIVKGHPGSVTTPSQNSHSELGYLQTLSESPALAETTRAAQPSPIPRDTGSPNLYRRNDYRTRATNSRRRGRRSHRALERGPLSAYQGEPTEVPRRRRAAP